DSAVAAAAVGARSQLERQRNDFQREPRRDEEESLKDLCARKERGYLYGLSAASSQRGSGHGSACSAGLRNKYPTSHPKALPAKPVTRRKEGVDRAYPLKPISPPKGESVPVVNTTWFGSSSSMEEAPKSRPSSKSREKPPAGKSPAAGALSPWTAEAKQPGSQLPRRELAYILKLEEDGRIMEKEIQKKEALLREKLMRAEEVLRRIQRARKRGEAEEGREAVRAQERKAARHPKEKPLQAVARPHDGASSGATVPKPGTTLPRHELDMERLKKERLLASNSKIRERVHVERLASCSKVAPKHSPSPSAFPDRGSGDHLSPEGLYLQASSALEQEELGQCSCCGRSFLCSRLEKHMSICSKSQGSKRKVFDSRKARARGTHLEEFQQWKISERPQTALPRRNNWREKHEVLIQTLRQARQVQQILSKGGNVSDLPLLPPIENPDYVACPYCGRRFDPQVAERHIPKCKTIKHRPPPPQQRR
ncbi:ZC21C protein, partial [Centropus bengalensis]|nr:ZC21C protein [Centropus bengalensis]